MGGGHLARSTGSPNYSVLVLFGAGVGYPPEPNAISLEISKPRGVEKFAAWVDNAALAPLTAIHIGDLGEDFAD